MIMRVFHAALAVAAVLVFLRRAPFDRPVRILFVFGYYVFYEYAVISRSYALSMLLLFVVLALIHRRRENFALIFFAMFFLANTHLFGAIIAGCLGLVLILDAWKAGPNGSLPWRVPDYGAMLLWALGLTLCVVQVRAEPDNTFGVIWLERWIDMPRFNLISDFLFSAYVPIPDFREVIFWNNNLVNIEPQWLLLVVALGIAAAGLLALIRFPLPAFFYALCTSLFLGLFYYSQLVWWRYVGHLFLVFIAGYWMSYVFEERDGHRWARFSRLLARPLLMTVLVLQVLGGVIAHLKDLQLPFSQGRAASRYIVANALDDLEIVAYRDYAISTLSAHLEKRLWYPQRQEWGSFAVYDRKRKIQVGLPEIATAVERVMSEKNTDRVLLITSTPFKDSADPESWQSYRGFLTPQIRLELLAYFDGSAVGDENHHIYLAARP
jgi:hypothetical protein